MSIASMMNKTATIETEAQTKGTAGGANYDYVARATGVLTRYMQLGADRINAYGMLGYKVDTRFYFNSEQTITIKDRIVCDGVKYEVKAVNDVQGLGRLWQVDCERLPK